MPNTGSLIIVIPPCPGRGAFVKEQVSANAWLNVALRPRSGLKVMPVDCRVCVASGRPTAPGRTE